MSETKRSTIHDTALSIASLAWVAGCGGSSPPAAVPTPAPYRYEFPTETKEAVTSSRYELGDDSFVGPDGRLKAEVIRGYVRAHFGTILICYEAGRRKDPKLTGKVTVKYVIGADGIPKEVVAESTTLSDEEVISCILALFRRLRYDPSPGGEATIVYPIQLP